MRYFYIGFGATTPKGGHVFGYVFIDYAGKEMKSIRDFEQAIKNQMPEYSSVVVLGMTELNRVDFDNLRQITNE